MYEGICMLTRTMLQLPGFTSSRPQTLNPKLRFRAIRTCLTKTVSPDGVAMQFRASVGFGASNPQLDP